MLIVYYSCRLCGTERREVKIPYRKQGTSIIHYMNNVVIPYTSRDHKTYRPACKPRTLNNLIIPKPTKEGQGQAEGDDTRKRVILTNSILTKTERGARDALKSA